MILHRPNRLKLQNTETVTVSITAEGTVSTEVHGIKGKSCDDVTRQLNAVLGIVTHDEKTPEYNEKPVETEADAFERAFNRH